MATNLTRINNNQITDASAGNAYVGVNAAVKLQNYTVTSAKLANNINYNSDLQVTGNLTVTGTTTTVDTVNTLIEDPLIVLASGQTSGTPTVDIGYIGLRGVDNNIALAWKEGASEFVAAFTTTDSGNSYSNTTFTIASYADFKANNITANSNLVVNGTTSLAGNIISTANVTGNLNAGNVNVVGNVSADYYYGNGYYLSGINVGNLAVTKIYNGGSYANIAAADGNMVVAIGNSSNLVATFYDTGVIFNGNVSVTGNINVQNSLNGANLSLTGNVDSNLNVTNNVTGGNITAVTLVSSGGNVSASSFLTGANLSLSGNVDGNLNVTDSVNGGNIFGVTLVSSGGNVSASSFLTGANLSLSGNVDGNLNVTDSVNGGNLVAVTLVSSGGNVSASSFLTGANLSLSGNVDGNLNVTTNVTGGNLVATTLISSGGNIYAVTDISAGANVGGGNINTGGNISAGGNITGGNITTTGASGNISGANVISSTTMSATGNVYGGNLISQLAVTAVGDITGGNIFTANAVSAGGNITGANLNTGNNVSATANIFGGNIFATSSGDISTAGNVWGGTNVNTPNVVSSGALALTAQGGDVNISASGNIGVSGLYIQNLADPLNNQDAATKYYVDTVAQGLTIIASTYAAAVQPLANISGGTITYNNGNAGVGANLVTTGAYTTIDGVNIAVANTRILVAGQANAVQNGVYVYSNATVLTRSADYDKASQIQPGDFVFNQYGNAYGNTQWVETANVTTIGTDPIVFTQFGGAGTYTAGNGIVINGVVISARVDTDTITFSGTGNLKVSDTANLVSPNIGNATGSSLSVDGNVTGGNLLAVTFISSGGNITASSFLTGANLSLSGNVDSNLNVTSTVTGGNIVGISLVSSGGNISASSFLTGANLSLSGNVDGNLNVTTSVNGGNLVAVTLVSSGGNISASSFLTGANLSLSGNVDGNLNVTTNVTGGNITATVDLSAGGNILTAGYVSALGNVTTANYFVGDGYYISNINAGNVSASKIFNGGSYANIASADANLVIAIGNGSNIVATFYDQGVNLTGPLSVGGNITGGNISTSGSGGNITGANVISSTTLTASGNVYAGSNFITGNITIPSTGNINAGTNFINNVIDPIQAQDAATKGYVDGFISGGITVSDGANSTVLALDGTLSLVGTSNQVNVQITAPDVVTFSFNPDISVTGNVLSANVSASGNVVGGNIVISGDDITDTNGRVNINSALGTVDFAVNGTAANVFYVSATNNSASFGSSTQTVNALVAFNATTSILAPVGNTNQRPPTGVTGMLRFNSTTNSLEIYNNTQWIGVGSTVFTVIADEQFAGDGSTVAYTLGSTQTTNSVIVSINGVLQIPTTAYSVSGVYPTCVLTFTEAPEPGDTIDVREITTTTTVNSITNSDESAKLLADPTYAQIDITGNLIPTSNVLQTLGNATNQWKSLYVSGNTIYLGGLQLTSSGNTFAVFESDGTTPATLDVGNIDVSSITAGNSSLGFRGTNGNAFITVNGTANVLTATTTGVSVTGTITANGNISGSYILGNGYTLTSINGANVTGLNTAAISNGTSNVSITTSNGSITAGVGGTPNVVVTSTTGISVAGTIQANGTITGGNVVTGGLISASANITGSYFIGNGYTLTSINGANVTGLNTAAITNGTSNVNIATSGGNITAAVNGTPNVVVTSTTGISVAGTIQANGTITGGNLSAGTGYISTTGNVTGGNVIVSGVLVSTNTISASGNITGGNISAGSGSSTAGSYSASGNVTGGNVVYGTGVVSGTGTVYAATVNAATIGNTGAVHNGTTVSVTGNVTGGNIIATGVLISSNTVSVAGNITGGNISAGSGSSTAGSYSASGNITGGNLNTTGTATIGGFTISANTIVSSGATLTLDPNGAGGLDGLVVIAGNLQVNGNTTTINSNVVTTNDLTINFANNAVNSSAANGGGIEVGPIGSPYITWTYYNIANTWTTAGGISATGNITGGNISIGSGSSTAGSYSASGNVTGGNIVYGTGVVSGTGTVYAATVNAATIGNASAVHNGATVSATGNVTGGNIIATGVLISSNTVSVAGNITGGNISAGSGASTAGSYSASGNVTGGNVIVSGVLISTNTISATGNITGGNISIGSGSSTAGSYSASGQITGGNITTAGQLTVNSGANVTAIVNGAASGVGNIGTATVGFNTVFAKATTAQYADLAEKYTADADYQPGTVVSFGGNAEITLSDTDADPRIAGVVSTQPAYSMNSGLQSEFTVMVALTGRVPCSVIGPVRKGDMMVAAGNGQARAEANPAIGTVIGKALEDFAGESGVIEVVVGRL